MPEPSPDSEAHFARLVVEQGLARPEDVEECRRLQGQLVEAGVTPVPKLGELLVRKGYLAASQWENTLRISQSPPATRRTRLTESQESELPAEAAQGTPLGKYVKTKKLGAGGMGEVWKAWDTELRRWVALKFLKGSDSGEIARFRREAQTAAKLTHPNIGAVYEAGDEFIAMQFVDGQTLETYPREDKRTIAEIVRQAALAVHFAHEQGVIHRDLKPANIMVAGGKKPPTTRRVPGTPSAPKAQAYVMDFGLAKSMNLDSKLSVSGTILGTPAYMSPEQARGSIQLDARTDVYSLGATLYELLADRPPFRDTEVYGLLKKVIEEDPKRLQGDLGTIALKCLEKDPRRRYATALDLAEDLGRFIAGGAIFAHPPSSLYRLRKFVGQRKSVVAATALAFAVGIAFGAWLITGAVKLARKVRQGLAEARHYESEKKLSKARDAYRSVLDLDEKNEEAQAGFNRTQDEIAEAARLLEQGRPALDQAFAYLYNPNAEYEELMKRVSAGQKLIERALEKAPESALGYSLLGRAWELQGWDDRAEECWRKAIAIDPDLGSPHYRLGRLLMTRAFMATLGFTTEERERKRPEATRLGQEAAKELEKAIGRGALDDVMERDLAAAMLANTRGERKEASQRAAEGTEKYRTSQGVEEFYWLAGRVLMDEKGESFLDRALALRPRFALASFCRGTIRQDKGDTVGAIADFTEALKTNPRLVEAYVNRALARAAKGNNDGAIADYNEALKIRPHYWGVYINRGGARMAKGDLDGAIGDCDEAVKLEPGYAAPYVTRAALWIEKGEFRRAIEDATKALELDPTVAKAHTNRGNARAKLGDLDGALADYDKELALHPPRAEVYVNRGAAEEQKGDLDTALADIDRALKIDPKCARAYLFRGNILQKKGNAEEAVQAYDQAIALDPKDAKAHYNRGNMRRAKGDLEGAIKDYSTALEIDPRLAEAYLNRGLLRKQAGDIHEAIRDYDEALKINPRLPAAYVNRGSARGSLGDIEGQIADFEKALEVAPADWPHRAQVEAGLKQLRKKP